MSLEAAWYAVIALSVLMYVLLDGFDLGVGALHLFGRTDEQRRMFLNAIGPVWDGNEVWIVIVMGGLFAGFPNVYATVFSGFYTLLMFLIAGLMFRAAAIEFRSKGESERWRQTWDCVFSFASILVAFVIGIILGNLIEGVPLNGDQDIISPFSQFFRPYSILVGILAVSLFTMHGAVYLNMKLEGEAHEVVKRWINPAIIFFLFCFAAATGATLLYLPYMTAPLRANPTLFFVPLLAFLAMLNIPRQVSKGNEGWAFISSCASIALLLSLYMIGNFPNIVRSTIDPIHNLTITNTASSKETLGILMIVVAIGIPLVLGYGFWIYRIFRGKVKLDKSSY